MSAPSAPCRVVYVEDNPGDVHLLQTVLSRGPGTFEVTILEDGEEALKFIEAKPFLPDVIVLDLNMPKVDGLTVLVNLKADLAMQSIPVLVFVSPGTPNCRRAEELEADLCLAKPFDLAGYTQIQAAILKLCRIHTKEESMAGGA